jgi:transposase
LASAKADRNAWLAKRGYSRDGKRGTLQIVYGLLCAPDGCPVASRLTALRGISPLCRLIEVFDGNTGDPTTLAPQIEKLKQRFHLDRVVLVGDRGMITAARIAEDLKTAGLDWITALCAPAIRDLLNCGASQLTLCDQRDMMAFRSRLLAKARNADMASITSPDFSDERLIVCRNPELAADRTRKREDLLVAMEKDLARIKVAVERKRNPLCGTADIALEAAEVFNAHKMKKHFNLEITDTSFSFIRKSAEIAAEAATDGIYVVRTSLAEDTLGDADTVRSYKSLSLVERGFRCIKTVDLHIRPVYHWLEDRVRAHVFLCILAYYLEWHMRQKLAPMLFHDTNREEAETQRRSVVVQTQRSKAAVNKQTTGLTENGLPERSFHSLLADLATLARNTITTAITPHYPLTVLIRPTPVRQKAFDLLGIKCAQ